MVGEDLRHAYAFQGLKRTYMHVSCLPPHILRFRKTCITCVSGPETHVYACLMSSPTIF